MNKLTEIKNNKVIYDGKDGKLLLPLNFSAIKELVPWLGEAGTGNQILNRIKGDTGFPYIYIDNKNEGYIILDTKSKIPTLFSGTYSVFNRDRGQYSSQAYKLLSKKKEIADILKLKYTPKMRIKYDMPYSEEELIGFSKKNQFAKVVYDLIQGGDDKDFDKLDNFLGDKVVLKGDYMSGANVTDEIEEIDFDDTEFSLETEGIFYAEKYMEIDEDSSWVFNAAMMEYDDCEEMDVEELQYIDHWMDESTKEKFLEVVDEYEPGYFAKNDVAPPNANGESEGVYDTFLSHHFEKEWDDRAWTVLEHIGCAVYRSRVQHVKQEIEEDLTYPIEVWGDKTKTTISYSQLLQLIGLLGINNFSELREWSINSIDGNLTDEWYDAWDMDDVGIKGVNEAMVDFLDHLLEKYEDKYDEAKNNELAFTKIMKDLGYEKPSWGYGGRDVWTSKDTSKDKSPNIRISEFKPIPNTVTIHSQTYKNNTPQAQNIGAMVKTNDVKVGDLANEILNLKIPFPE